MHRYVLDDRIKLRMLEQQPDALFYIAALGQWSTMLYISPQVEVMLGFTPEEWMAEPQGWLTHVHQEDKGFVLLESDRLRRTHDAQPLEYRMVARNGSIVWFREHADIERDETGVPRFQLGMIRDITEIKRQEAELHETRRRLAQFINILLTEEERGALCLARQGYTDMQIAVVMHCSERSVRYRLKNAADKLGVCKRREALYEAQRLGMFDM